MRVICPIFGRRIATEIFPEINPKKFEFIVIFGSRIVFVHKSFEHFGSGNRAGIRVFRSTGKDNLPVNYGYKFIQ